MQTTRRLVIIERAYRGGVETQFADALYILREMHRQLGGLDLALRGLAVTYALGALPVPSVRLPGGQLPMPDPRASVASLLGDGMAVFVDASDLGPLGMGPERLVPGVTCLDPSELVGIWERYDGIWFL